jgi:hypothetical protein
MRQLILLLFLLTQARASVALANGAQVKTEIQSARPDSHAPLGVMGDHAHSSGEWMLSYRFMAMRMHDLRNGTQIISTDNVLQYFAVSPVRMSMQMHIIGAMFAPHSKLTLMAMTSYRDKYMEMQGGTHGKSHGHRQHSAESHEMESSGLGDAKLFALIPFIRSQDVVILMNAGLSIPTGSIAAEGMNGILPYPMQLGSGSIELMPGVTFSAIRNNWSFGVQTRAAIPINENSRGYRRAPLTMSMLWSARRLNDWISVSTRALFENWGNIVGEDDALNPKITPTMDPQLQGGARASLLLGSNLIFPDRAGSLLAGQRFALELRLPIYQHLDGPQMALNWSVIAGWQYALKFNH